MKKTLFSLLLLFIFTINFGNQNRVQADEKEMIEISKSDGSGSVKYFGTNTPVLTPKTFVQKEEEMRAVWVSAVTPDVIKHTSQYMFKSGIQKVITTLKENNMNTMIYHVRPTNDAFYPSKLNPWSRYFLGKYSDSEAQITDPGWDPFQYVIDECHKNDIEIHAWFNPYRVTTTKPEGITKEEYLATKLNEKNFARKNPQYVVEDTTGKLLLNPGEKEVINFVSDTVMEVVNNYAIDGVHFDDYFYSYEGYEKSFDQETYLKNKKPDQSIDDFRRSSVDELIEDIGMKIREFNRSHETTIEFGISPFGIWDNKKNNPLGSGTAGLSSYRTCYADTRKWVKEEWIDYIMPQIYWHFEHTAAPYADLVDWWNDVISDTNVSLYIGHAVYKYDKLPIEWKNSPDELAMQINYNTKFENVKGSAFFSYQYLRDMNSNPKYEMIKNVVNKIRSEMWTKPVPVPISKTLQDNPVKAPSNLKSEGKIVEGNRVKIYFDPAESSEVVDHYALFAKVDKGEYCKTEAVSVHENALNYFEYILPKASELSLRVSALIGTKEYKSSELILQYEKPKDFILNDFDIKFEGNKVLTPTKISFNLPSIQNNAQLQYFLVTESGEVLLNERLTISENRVSFTEMMPDQASFSFKIKIKTASKTLESSQFSIRLEKESPKASNSCQKKANLSKTSWIKNLIYGGIFFSVAIILFKRKR